MNRNPFKNDDSEGREEVEQLADFFKPGILIGGWASRAMVDAAITHDIDFILPHRDRTVAKTVLNKYSDTSHLSRKISGEFRNEPSWVCWRF